MVVSSLWKSIIGQLFIRCFLRWMPVIRLFVLILQSQNIKIGTRCITTIILPQIILPVRLDWPDSRTWILIHSSSRINGKKRGGDTLLFELSGQSPNMLLFNHIDNSNNEIQIFFYGSAWRNPLWHDVFFCKEVVCRWLHRRRIIFLASICSSHYSCRLYSRIVQRQFGQVAS